MHSEQAQSKFIRFQIFKVFDSLDGFAPRWSRDLSQSFLRATLSITQSCRPASRLLSAPWHLASASERLKCIRIHEIFNSCEHVWWLCTSNR
jgi:hypothetical protein